VVKKCHIRCRATLKCMKLNVLVVEMESPLLIAQQRIGDDRDDG